MRRLVLLLPLLLASSTRAQVSGGATVSGSASLNAACTPVCATGPLAQSGVNSHYFINTFTGKPVYLTGSHTWNDFDDTSTAAVPSAFPFSQFVTMLKTNGHSVTILWHKDMPRENWQGSTWNLLPQAWQRTGPGNASDGLPKFDLTQFNQPFFDKMRSEVVTLYLNGIYAIVQLFDCNNLTSARLGNTSPTGDGFPLTGVNNINSVSDSYTSGAAGVGSCTMASAATNPSLVAVQDAYVRKMIDTLNDLPNVILEVAEEQPGTSFSGTPGYGGASSMTWWVPHILELIKTYEGGGTCTSCAGSPVYSPKPLKHVAGVGSMNFNDQNDPALYASTAQWLAPTLGATTFPANVATNNQGKLVINDSDHSLFYTAFVNSGTGVVNDIALRGYIWQNFTNGAAGQVLMDPYIISLPTSQRNPCASPTNGICANPLTKYDPVRAAMGYTQKLIPTIVNLLAMTPQPALSSTGFCLANNTATTSEFVVYSLAASSFTVNLSGQSGRNITVAWLDPTTGAISISSVLGGNATQSFSAPWGNAHDAVLHLSDGGATSAGSGNPQIPLSAGWFQVPNTSLKPSLCPTYSDIQGTGGCAAVTGAWNGALFDSRRERFNIRGGGHTDYFGNEIYGINTSLNPMTTSLVRDASHGANLNANCVDVNPDSSLSIRHLYNGELYNYWLDQYFYYGGSKSTCGSFSNSIVQYDPITNVDTAISATGSLPNDPSNGNISGTAYYQGDETHEPAIYDWGPNDATFRVYSPYTQAWTLLTSSDGQCTPSTNHTVSIDPVQRLFYVAGNGKLCSISLDSPYTMTTITLTGCGTAFNTPPGMKWDPVNQDMAVWNGGSNVYSYASGTCTLLASSGGPGAAMTNGTFGRWDYDAQNGVWEVFNDMTGSLWTFRRDTAANLQAKDWNRRSTASGVIAATSFDNSADFLIHGGNVTGMKNSTSNGSQMTQDTTTFASGGSSAKCVVNAQSGPDACGSYWLVLPTHVVPGSTFYVYFRQKIDANVLAQCPASCGTVYPKQVIIASTETGTCAKLEVTTVSIYDRGSPFLYTNCGAGPMSSSIDLGNGDFLLEEGEHSASLGAVRDTGFNCHYQIVNNNARSCATYPASVWVGYYYKITLGAFGTPTSTVQAWRHLPGQPYMMWANIQNGTINIDAGGIGFNLIDLLNYWTARDGSQPFGQTGNTWYDELIISSNPIAPGMAPVN